METKQICKNCGYSIMSGQKGIDGYSYYHTCKSADLRLKRGCTKPELETEADRLRKMVQQQGIEN